MAYGTVPQTEAHFSWTSYDGESEAVLRVGTHSGSFDLPDVVADKAVTCSHNPQHPPVLPVGNPTATASTVTFAATSFGTGST